MSYLLDTNVLSELCRKAPDPRVVAWAENRPTSTLFLSVLTLGEMRKGIESMANSKRRLALRDWLETDLPAFFAGRILAINMQVADRWGRIVAAAGKPVPAIDSLLAATALHHGLGLVTRNARDFSFPGLEVLDPWKP